MPHAKFRANPLKTVAVHKEQRHTHTNTPTDSVLYIHCVSKKRPTLKLSLTLSNLNLFSKFLHCWNAYEICYKSKVGRFFLRHSVYILVAYPAKGQLILMPAVISS